jgi:mannose-6-phosphate isomerase-like protein (cupin superfamily)
MFDTIAAPAGVQVLDRTRARTQHVAGLRVTRWAQFGLEGQLPFQAMWYAVPPSGSTYQDCHPEAELSLVVTGTATVEALGGLVEVRQGEAFLLPAGEPHVVHNRCEDADLVVFSAYWLPAGPAGTADLEGGAR